MFKYQYALLIVLVAILGAYAHNHELLGNPDAASSSSGPAPSAPAPAPIPAAPVMPQQQPQRFAQPQPQQFAQRQQMSGFGAQQMQINRNAFG